MMKRYISIFLLFLLSLTAFSQRVRVKAGVDSSEIFIGDQVNYTVTVRQPSGLELSMPEFTDSLYRDIEIISQSPVDTSFDNAGDMVLKKNYVITSFDTGFYQIPPYYLKYETESGSRRFFSNYVPLRVRRVEIAPADSTAVIFDIVGPEKVGYGAGEILPWILLAIAVIAGSWMLVRYWPWRKKAKEGQEAGMPTEPIHIIAFREFDKLEKKKLWQNGKIKEYYSELTDIIRYYIEIRYSIMAPEMTSEEIISGLSVKEIGEDNVKRLGTILKNADLSKFAKYTHDPATNSNALEEARQFVRETYVRENDMDDEEAGSEKRKEDKDE